MAAAALRLAVCARARVCLCVCERITCPFLSREHGGGDGAGQVGQMTSCTRARTCTYAQVLENHITVVRGLQIHPGGAELTGAKEACPGSWCVRVRLPPRFPQLLLELSGESIHGRPISAGGRGSIDPDFQNSSCKVIYIC